MKQKQNYLKNEMNALKAGIEDGVRQRDTRIFI